MIAAFTVFFILGMYFLFFTQKKDQHYKAMLDRKSYEIKVQLKRAVEAESLVKELYAGIRERDEIIENQRDTLTQQHLQELLRSKKRAVG